ncbi:MAG: hypothetical protein JXM69_02245 [Anaerolineae bacterium]|nr:hypothetical protein [Anaerolineae bacterium]
MTQQRQSRQQWAAMLIALVTITLACSVPSTGGGDTPVSVGRVPQVTISQPSAGAKLELGQEVKIQSTSIDIQTGIVRVELVIDNQVIWVDANPHPQPNEPYLVAQPWTPQLPGSHVIQVRAYNADNVPGQTEPLVVEVVASAQAVGETALSPTGDPQPEMVTPTNTPVSLVGAPASPTSTPSLPVATKTVTPTMTPMMTPTTTSTPTPTPTPGTFKPTGLEPDGRLKDIWQELGSGKSRLGYPTGPEITDRNYARQYFEKGLMVWWENPAGPSYIWVIDSPADDGRSGATWNRYEDTWDGGDEYSCDQAHSNREKGPVRGFGKVWCERPELQFRLGNPREQEVGSGGNPPYAHVQFFQGGVMIVNPLNNDVFVLFDQGDWQRFGY